MAAADAVQGFEHPSADLGHQLFSLLQALAKGEVDEGPVCPGWWYLSMGPRQAAALLPSWRNMAKRISSCIGVTGTSSRAE